MPCGIADCLVETPLSTRWLWNLPPLYRGGFVFNHSDLNEPGTNYDKSMSKGYVSFAI